MNGLATPTYSAARQAQEEAENLQAWTWQVRERLAAVRYWHPTIEAAHQDELAAWDLVREAQTAKWRALDAQARALRGQGRQCEAA